MAVKRYDFVVLGAGVAGLAFAWKMIKAGKSVLVLEKEHTVGGLARTLKYRGFRMDFCGHRFHTANQDVLRTVLSLKYLRMHKHRKKVRIHMFGKYLTYPFELPNLLRAMPFSLAINCCLDYLISRMREKIERTNIRSYKDWFVALYGSRLYDVMCYPYTAKIWHIDPSRISADWAEQRFGGPNLRKLIEKSIKKLLSLDFSRYDLEDDSLAPDGGEFYYPEAGYQELPDAFAKEAEEAGAVIACGVTVDSIDTEDKRVTYKKYRKKIVTRYRSLISTIPIPALYSLQNRKNTKIESLIKKNRYMDIIFVYLFVDQPRISHDHWIYFPNREILFNRAVEFTNWSKKMAPRGKTVLCFDITCYARDTIWQQTDASLVERTIEDASRVGYLPKDRVSGSYVKRLRYAYPVYDLNYKRRLTRIVSFLETRDVYLLGRTGIFRYNNSDNSIEMALVLAQNFIEKRSNASIFDYSIKGVSL